MSIDLSLSFLLFYRLMNYLHDLMFFTSYSIVNNGGIETKFKVSTMNEKSYGL